MFPVQIVVIKELDMEEHAWLKALSEDVGRENARKLLEKIKGLAGQEDRDMADSVLRVMMDANAQIVEEWRGDADMFETLMEIMEPQMQLRDEQIRREGRKEGMVQGAVDVLRELGHTDADIKAVIMKKYGLSTEEAKEYL